MVFLRKAYQLCAGRFRHLLSFTDVLILGILLPVTGHVTASSWEAAVPSFLFPPLGRIAMGLDVAAFLGGGLIFAFAKKDSHRELGEILLVLGVVLAGIKMSSVFMVSP